MENFGAVSKWVSRLTRSAEEVGGCRLPRVVSVRTRGKRWGRTKGNEERPRAVAWIRAEQRGLCPKGRKDRPTQYFLPALYAPWSNAVSPLVFIGQVLTSSSFVFSPRGVIQKGFTAERWVCDGARLKRSDDGRKGAGWGKEGSGKRSFRGYQGSRWSRSRSGRFEIRVAL